MREKKYHIYLTDDEQSRVIQSLINLKNNLIVQGRYTDAVDEVLLKVLSARKRNWKSNNFKHLCRLFFNRNRRFFCCQKFFEIFLKKCLHYLNISYIFIFLQISLFINIFVYFKLFTIPSIIFRSEGKYIFAPILFNINAVTKLAPRIPFIKFGSLEYCSFKAFKLTFFNKFSLFL